MCKSMYVCQSTYAQNRKHLHSYTKEFSLVLWAVVTDIQQSYAVKSTYKQSFCCRCIVSTYALSEIRQHGALLWFGEGSQSDTPTLPRLALGLHLVDAPGNRQTWLPQLYTNCLFWGECARLPIITQTCVLPRCMYSTYIRMYTQ